MKKLYPLVVVLLFCLSCSRQMAPPHTTIAAEHIEPTDSLASPVDSLAPSVALVSKTESKRNVLHRVLGLFKTDDAKKIVHINSKVLPKKCKNCTITINEVKGNQTNEHTVVGKKGQAATGKSHLEAQTKVKGPASSGTSSAKDLSNSGAVSDITGNNNSPQLTNTAPAKLSGWDLLLDNLTGPTGQVIAGIVAALAVIGFIKFGLPLLLKKKINDSTLG